MSNFEIAALPLPLSRYSSFEDWPLSGIDNIIPNRRTYLSLAQLISLKRAYN